MTRCPRGVEGSRLVGAAALVTLACWGCAAPEAGPVAPPVSPVPPASRGAADAGVDAVDAAVNPAVVEAIAGDVAGALSPRSRFPEHLREVEPATTSGLRDFVAAFAGDGLFWVGPLAGNGGRDVLIHIPAGAAETAELRLVYHFHGTYSEHLEPPGPGVPKQRWVGWDRLGQAIDGAAELQAVTGGAVALVYPLSAGKRMEPTWRGWSNKAYDRIWMLSPTGATGSAAVEAYTDDFTALDAATRELLGARFGVAPGLLPQRSTAQGHSAGGIALWNLARSGARGIADYIFLDAGFHLWADGCYAAIQAQGGDARVILVIRDGGIADPLAGPDPWCVTHPELAATWPKVQEQCEGQPSHRPKAAPGRGKLRCDTWEANARGWPELAGWCAGIADGMRGVAGVRVHRTKVAHGRQPREFFGGLRIPGAGIVAPERTAGTAGATEAAGASD